MQEHDFMGKRVREKKRREWGRVNRKETEGKKYNQSKQAKATA